MPPSGKTRVSDHGSVHQAPTPVVLRPDDRLADGDARSSRECRRRRRTDRHVTGVGVDPGWTLAARSDDLHLAALHALDPQLSADLQSPLELLLAGGQHSRRETERTADAAVRSDPSPQ